LRFRGREMAHKEIGFQQVEKLVKSLLPFGHPDAPAKLIGKGINVMLSPLPRAKRGKNPHQPEAGGNGENAAPPPEGETNDPDPKEETPAQGAAGNGKEFGNNAFANLELKPGG